MRKLTFVFIREKLLRLKCLSPAKSQKNWLWFCYKERWILNKKKERFKESKEFSCAAYVLIEKILHCSVLRMLAFNKNLKILTSSIFEVKSGVYSCIVLILFKFF